MATAQLNIRFVESKEINEGQQVQIQMLLDGKPENASVVWEIGGNIHPSMSISSEGMFNFFPDFKTVGRSEGSKFFQLDIRARATMDSVYQEALTSFSVNVLNANTAPKVPAQAEIVWIEKPNEELVKTFQPQYYRDEEGDQLAFRLLTRKYPNISLTPTGELSVSLSTKDRKALPDTLIFEVFEVDTDESLAAQQKIILQKAEKDEAPMVTFFPATEKFQLNEEETLELKVNIEDANDDLKTVDFYTNPQGKMKPSDFMKKDGDSYLFSWKPSLEFVTNELTSKSFLLVITATDEAKLSTTKQVEVEIFNKIDWITEDSIRTADYKKSLTDAYVFLAILEPQLENMAKEFKKKNKNKELLGAFSSSLAKAQNLRFNSSSSDNNILNNLGTVADMSSGLLSNPDYAPIEKLIRIIPKMYFQSCLLAIKFKRIADRRSPEFLQSQENMVEVFSEARFLADEKKKPKKLDTSPQAIQAKFGAF